VLTTTGTRGGAVLSNHLPDKYTKKEKCAGLSSRIKRGREFGFSFPSGRKKEEEKVTEGESHDKGQCRRTVKAEGVKTW